ncbi:hypothetical protein MTQ22_00055 [Corynebacterium bovis]|uniref:hypothetical protein n=1 Tax=Corynebacterium bovis TaxID=36808 RepID=UPI003138E773
MGPSPVSPSATPLIVFDLPGVLVPAPDPAVTLSAVVARHRPGPDPATAAALAASYARYRESYCLSMGPRDFATAVLRSAGVDPDPALVEDLVADDTARCSTPEPPTLRLLMHLRATGRPYAVFADAPQPVVDRVRAADWGRAAAVTSFSVELRFTTPHQGAFRRFDRQVALAGFDPAAVVYFGSDEAALTVAARRGWDAHRWEGVDAAHRVLTPPAGLRQVP